MQLFFSCISIPPGIFRQCGADVALTENREGGDSTPEYSPAFEMRRCGRCAAITKKLYDPLLQHRLRDLHKAGDVRALHIVDRAAGLGAEFDARLVDALHNEV